MSNLIPFSFESREIRVVIIGEQPMFSARDVALALGYSNPSEAYTDHCKYLKLLSYSELLELNWVNPNPRGEYVMPEPDVYRLVIKSTKPEAERFERWVFDEVLPSIRKTGYYSAQAEPLNDPAVIALQLADSIKNKIDSLNLLLEHVSDLHVMLSGQKPVEIQQKPIKNQPVDYSIAKTKILEAICDARGQGITERQLQQSCWTFRNTPKLKRQGLLAELIEESQVLGIMLANKRTPTYFGRQYIKSA